MTLFLATRSLFNSPVFCACIHVRRTTSLVAIVLIKIHLTGAECSQPSVYSNPSKATEPGSELSTRGPTLELKDVISFIQTVWQTQMIWKHNHILFFPNDVISSPCHRRWRSAFHPYYSFFSMGVAGFNRERKRICKNVSFFNTPN